MILSMFFKNLPTLFLMQFCSSFFHKAPLQRAFKESLRTSLHLHRRHRSESIYTCVRTSYADVHLVPMFSDNYGFILVDKATNMTTCIDPGDGDVMASALQYLGLSLDFILSTHKHTDHVGGNLALKRIFPRVSIIGTKYEPIPGIDKKVGEGDNFCIGSLEVRVKHTPCHTVGHIVYIVDSSKSFNDSSKKDRRNANIYAHSSSALLFCGDTLFVGGCGRFFEGTAEDMLANMDFLGGLPPDTKVFCAHEYTESNLCFLKSIDPNVCVPVYERVLKMRSEGQPTIPSSIGEELEYNLFMKCRDARTQEIVGVVDAVQAMATLRAKKNAF